MKTPTDQQLKLALAKELPELIVCAFSDEVNDTGEDSERGRHFYHVPEMRGLMYRRVTEREWDWVVQRLLDEMTSEQIELFYWNLANLIPTTDEWKLTNVSVMKFVPIANWKMKAIAYFKTIRKEVA